jgi:hypothetical protein
LPRAKSRQAAKKLPTLDVRLARLNKPQQNARYYAITLTADAALNVTFATQTIWVGWADGEMRHELRKARWVGAEFAKLWQLLRQPFSYIHTPDELMLFLLGGGNALVEKELADQVFHHQLAADVALPHGRMPGFVGADMFEKSAFRRAPTPKIRMQVIKRDNRRCRICGRRPDDDTDIVLHVHHIHPWNEGGVTDPSNLITLCHTCHNGLMPHKDKELYSYISSGSDEFGSSSAEFKDGVASYRRAGFFGVNAAASKDRDRDSQIKRGGQR